MASISNKAILKGIRLTSRYFSTTSVNKEKLQFLVIANDYTDDQALERRLSVREAHLAKASQAKAEKVLHVGGAIFDDHANKKMLGSFLLLSADSLDEAEKIVTNDIYFKSKVWEKYKIYPVKSAISLE